MSNKFKNPEKLLFFSHPKSHWSRYCWRWVCIILDKTVDTVKFGAYCVFVFVQQTQSRANTHPHTHTGNPSTGNPSPRLSISGHVILSRCDTTSQTLISGDTQCSSLSVTDFPVEEKKCAKSHLLRQITSPDLCCAVRLARHPSDVTVSPQRPSSALRLFKLRAAVILPPLQNLLNTADSVLEGREKKNAMQWRVHKVCARLFLTSLHCMESP